jgi:pilus assembly protein CpaB
MLKRQTIIALGVAVLLGLAAVYFANIFISGNEQRARAATAGTVKVAVAAVPLTYGTDLTPEKIRFINYPANNVPAGSFSDMSQLLPMGKKRAALIQMAANEPILKGKITGEGMGASIAALLPPGKRAASVRINDVSGVSGFVQPNDSVDVLVTRKVLGNQRDVQVTDVLLQDVRVLAIGQDAKGQDGKPQVAKTATLEVDPLDAQKLALAQQIGSLSLVLRKPGQQENSPLVETVSLDDLRYNVYGGTRFTPQPLPVSFAAPAPAVAPAARLRRAIPAVQPKRTAPKPPANNVEVFRGMERSNYEVGRYGS